MQLEMLSSGCEHINKTFVFNNTNIFVWQHHNWNLGEQIFEYSKTNTRVQQHQYLTSVTPMFEYSNSGIATHKKKENGCTDILLILINIEQLEKTLYFKLPVQTTIKKNTVF